MSNIKDTIDNLVLTNKFLDNVEFKQIGKTIQRYRKNIEKERLDKKIDEVIQDQLSTFDEKDWSLVRPILVNQSNHLRQTTSYDPVHNMQMFKILMRITAKVFHSLSPIQKLIGFQPMPGPVGLVYKMEYTTPEKQSNEKTTEEAVNATLNSGKQLRLEVISAAVEAGSRKLQTGWTLEAVQDLKSCNLLDFEQELINILGHEVADEISYEILLDLVAIANKSEASRTVTYDSITSLATKLVIDINHQFNEIGKATRRGMGNVVVTTPTGLAVLQTAFGKTDGYVIRSCTSDLGPNTHLAMEVCYQPTAINEEPKVFFTVISTLSPALWTKEDEKLRYLIGYNGRSECDSGYIYCPYVPIMPSGVVVNPVTFQPVVTLMTRYGKHVSHKGDRSLGDVYNYYNMLTVDAPLSF